MRLDLTDLKIGSQDAVKKVLELTEKWKYPNFRGIFFLQKSVGSMILLQLLGIHYSTAFCSTLLSFFVLKIFGFNKMSLFIRYFGSISRFEQFVQPCNNLGWPSIECLVCVALFQDLKNDQFVTQHHFFSLFKYFKFFYTRPRGNQKRKEVSSDLFCDLGP